ncbi:MAG TPA: response regulator [Pirellulaceae bacterium]|jgi:CheY-like chemotaxis protein
MPKRVLDIGNCVPDHAAIRRLLETTFRADVTQVDDGPGALAALRKEPFDLILVNRKLDIDYSDGLEIIQQIKAHPKLAAIPCMLITNYPDQQQLAVAAGAEPGFGKKELHTDQTKSRLAKFLTSSGEREA